MTNQPSILFLQLYFSKFGYMNPKAFNPQFDFLHSEDTLRNAIIDFQVRQFF